MKTDNIRIRLTDDRIGINLKEQDSLSVNFTNRLVLRYVEPDHSKLDNLDYENSGHTGFMPAKLSLLPNTNQNVQNGRLKLAVFNTESEETTNMDFDELKDRIIKTSNAVAQNDQKGQYIFLEINEGGK